MAAGPISERNQDATIYVGGLDDKVSESLLWELFVQAGPVVNVHMPKDRVTQMHQGYGFVEFMGEEDADYGIKIMNMIKLFGKPIRVNKASAHQKNLDVGANIFIGNLDPEVDEKLLYDTFSAFGVILQTPKIMRDPETGNSKGYAFINFASFEASDAAIEAMNGQYLCNRPISISYAFKKDAKGERHGSAAERLLAAQNPLSQADRPHQLFADAPPAPMSMAPSMPAPPPMGMNFNPHAMQHMAPMGMHPHPVPPPMGGYGMPHHMTHHMPPPHLMPQMPTGMPMAPPPSMHHPQMHPGPPPMQMPRPPPPPMPPMPPVTTQTSIMPQGMPPAPPPSLGPPPGPPPSLGPPPGPPPSLGPPPGPPPSLGPPPGPPPSLGPPPGPPPSLGPPPGPPPSLGPPPGPPPSIGPPPGPPPSIGQPPPPPPPSMVPRIPPPPPPFVRPPFPPPPNTNLPPPPPPTAWPPPPPPAPQQSY